MNPGTPFSLLLIAAGGILYWGIDDRVEAVNLGAIGVILMLVGALGLIMSLAFWSTLFGRNDRAVVHDRPTTVVRESPTVVVRDEPRVVEREVVDRGEVVERETRYRR